MSSGSYTSASTTSAHKHSNTAGDGGSLDLTDTAIETNLTPLTTAIIFGG